MFPYQILFHFDYGPHLDYILGNVCPKQLLKDERKCVFVLFYCLNGVWLSVFANMCRVCVCLWQAEIEEREERKRIQELREQERKKEEEKERLQEQKEVSAKLSYPSGHWVSLHSINVYESFALFLFYVDVLLLSHAYQEGQIKETKFK